jgi:glycosyltransferase involved in cell wall biosynthesis
MARPETCAAVIPCFTEGAAIASLVVELRQHLATVIVVDDGSTDDTASQALAAGATLLRHVKNLGKGAALKTGLSAALKAGFEWAVTLDGDGQHKPQDLPALLDCARQTGARLVVGNRMHNACAIPWLRRHINRWMSRRISARAGQFLPDSQCGFRLINLQAWAGLSLETEHFEIESEMLLTFVRAGYRVEFVPIQVVGRSAHSHVSPIRDACRWLRWWKRSASPTPPALAAPAARPLRAGTTP